MQYENWTCIRDNLNNRKGQPAGTPVDKNYFPGTRKGVRCYHNFQIWREGDYCKCTLVVPLYQLISLCIIREKIEL